MLTPFWLPQMANACSIPVTSEHMGPRVYFEKLVHKPPKQVDVLLLEGSTIGGLDADDDSPQKRS